MIGLQSFSDDDPAFIAVVDRVIRGVVGLHNPDQFLVHRIDNWFGSKWLRFAGKGMGAIGVWDNSYAIVPPFVRNRITAQALFRVSDCPDQYIHVGDGPQIHHDGPSSDNFTNRVRTTIPETALFWFGGQSQSNGRGSLMGYTICSTKHYWGWYLEYVRNDEWRIAKQIEFDDNELQMLDKYGITVVGT